ncbi:Superoxide dismutase [Mn/Fe] [compost metagenome]
MFISEFGSLSNFKKEFTAAATNIEGSGWAILGWHPVLKKFMILTAEKHQNLTIWEFMPILAIDMWEHSYFLDHKNLKAKYIEALWNIINWDVVAARYMAIKNRYLYK